MVEHGQDQLQDEDGAMCHGRDTVEGPRAGVHQGSTITIHHVAGRGESG